MKNTSGVNKRNNMKELLRKTFHELAHAVGLKDHDETAGYDGTSMATAKQTSGSIPFFRGGVSNNSAAQCVEYNALNN